MQRTSTVGGLTRRAFVARSAAGLAFPYLVPRSVFGAAAPSNRIAVGIIGMGNQCETDLPAFLAQSDVQVVAACDVNRASHNYKTPDQYLGLEPGRDKVNAFYAKKTSAGRYRGCDAYRDFREVLARNDIDAVAIIVPDHWHGVMTAMACRAGKDIYCEKPLSVCIAQGREMISVVRRHQRILQTGSQLRSGPKVRRACELVRNGRIGQVKRVLCSIPPNNAVGPGPGWKPMPVPDGFDYDLWLGPAAQAPYHVDRCLYRFRFILEYSGGQVTNFGAHVFDMAQWGLGTENTGPVEVESLGAEWPTKGSLFTTAIKAHFRCRYANGVELVCQTGGYRTRFEGTAGWIEVTPGGFTCSPASLADSAIGPNETHLPAANPQRQEHSPPYWSADHVRNFIDSIKSRRDPIEPVEAGHRTASICHLGNIAMLLNRKLRWDPAAERFPEDAEAQAMVTRALRGPWTF
jgi:predicted dehydrogenase